MRSFLPLLLLAACAPRTPATTGDGESEPEAPQITLHGVRVQYFKGSELTAAGRAAKLAYQRSGGAFVAHEVLVRLPSRPGPSPGGGAPGESSRASGLEVRAPLVEGNLDQRRGLASGGVLLRSGSGVVGRTPSARFDGAQGTAGGEEAVQVTGPGYAVDSRGFAFDFAREQFTFLNGAHSRVGRAR